MILAEEEAPHNLRLEHLGEALSVLTPTQASRIHAHYVPVKRKWRVGSEMPEGI